MARTKQHHTGRNKTVYYRQHRRIMDADQIKEMLTPEKLQEIESRKADPFLPGEGQFYCLVCDKHFVDANAFESHKRGG